MRCARSLGVPAITASALDPLMVACSSAELLRRVSHGGQHLADVGVLAEHLGDVANGGQPGIDDLLHASLARRNIARAVGHSAMCNRRPIVDDEDALAGDRCRVIEGDNGGRTNHSGFGCETARRLGHRVNVGLRKLNWSWPRRRCPPCAGRPRPDDAWSHGLAAAGRPERCGDRVARTGNRCCRHPRR